MRTRDYLNGGTSSSTSANHMLGPRGRGPSTHALWLAIPLFLLSSLITHAQLRVIEEEAIPFTGFLSKAKFDERYPGKEVSDVSQLDSGWYVVYQHESLSYYFGPILLESTGEDYLAQLEAVVGDAVAQRPDIQNYRLELSFEPSEISQSGGQSGQDASQQPSEQNPQQDPGASGSPPPPPQEFSLFGLIKRIFGL